MDPKRWEAIQDVLLDALEREGDARAAYLDEACAGDPEMRSEVESLIAATEGDDVLDSSLDDLVLLLDEESANSAPERAGPYRIHEEIGRGGMGVVYRAERDDDQYSREVALKLVGAMGIPRDELAHRFRREQQILAGLEHPNIARLYDAGITEAHTPWLAMELVRGEPITTYCDERTLTVAERLMLFEKVVQAIDYAHRNLVVHRDLKPSNILVTDDGDVKLLDFGIAKLLDAEDPAPGDEPLTRMDQRILTPEYASPEQLDGVALTTASDVYSLGVLLHQLLTGRRPVLDPTTRHTTGNPSAVVTRPWGEADGSTEEPAEVARARATTPDRLRKMLRGELDTIVLTSLSADPSERYPTAAALLGDLVRHRVGLPLTARPPSFGYRARKFVSRNRVAVGAAAAVVIALVVGLGTALQQSRVARAERDVAQAVSAFIEGLFSAGNPFMPGERLDTLRVSAFLERAAQSLDTALVEQPLVRARMQRVLGSVHSNVGLEAAAVPLLEASIEANRELLGEDHPEIGVALQGLGRSAIVRGETAESERYYREALAHTVRSFGDASTEASNVRLELAGALMSLDKLGEAEELISAALEVRRDAMQEVSPAVANQLNILGSLQYRQGKLELAAPTMFEALEMSREVNGEDHPQAVILGLNLGVVLLRANRHEEAETLLRESLDGLRAAFGPDHPNIGPSTRTLANVVDMLGRWDEAEILYQEALAHSRRVVGEQSGDVASALHDYGLALSRHGRADEAVAMLEQAVAIERAVKGPASAPAGIVASTLAFTRLKAGDARRAEREFRDAERILTNIFPPGHPRLLAVQGGLGQAYLAQDRFDEALAMFEATYATANELEDGGVAAGGAARDLERYYRATGDDAEAARWQAIADEAGTSPLDPNG